MAAMGVPAAFSDAMKNRRRTTTKAKRPSAPKVRGRRKPSSTKANTKIALLKRERDEALEQQTATSKYCVSSRVARRFKAGFRSHAARAQSGFAKRKFGNCGYTTESYRVRRACMARHPQFEQWQ